MARKTAAEWSKLVERWRRSKLTAREFAAREGIAPSTLAWWKWRLGSKTERRSQVAVVPVEVVPVRAPTTETSVEVVLGNVVVRVRSGFDAQTLGRVLDVLEGDDAC
jgi:hypothetical protein